MRLKCVPKWTLTGVLDRRSISLSLALHTAWYYCGVVVLRRIGWSWAGVSVLGASVSPVA